jgi:hypothetical protein
VDRVGWSHSLSLTPRCTFKSEKRTIQSCIINTNIFKREFYLALQSIKLFLAINSPLCVTHSSRRDLMQRLTKLSSARFFCDNIHFIVWNDNYGHIYYSLNSFSHILFNFFGSTWQMLCRANVEKETERGRNGERRRTRRKEKERIMIKKFYCVWALNELC